MIPVRETGLVWKIENAMDFLMATRKTSRIQLLYRLKAGKKMGPITNIKSLSFGNG